MSALIVGEARDFLQTRKARYKAGNLEKKYKDIPTLGLRMVVVLTLPTNLSCHSSILKLAILQAQKAHQRRIWVHLHIRESNKEAKHSGASEAIYSNAKQTVIYDHKHRSEGGKTCEREGATPSILAHLKGGMSGRCSSQSPTASIAFSSSIMYSIYSY